MLSVLVVVAKIVSPIDKILVYLSLLENLKYLFAKLNLVFGTLWESNS